MNVPVAYDEMNVYKDAVSDKSGKVVGFTDTGDINHKLRLLEQSCKGVENKTPILTLFLAFS
jgi:hypothetical protein